jgi:hypothetical protein
VSDEGHACWYPLWTAEEQAREYYNVSGAVGNQLLSRQVYFEERCSFLQHSMFHTHAQAHMRMFPRFRFGLLYLTKFNYLSRNPSEL